MTETTFCRTLVEANTGLDSTNKFEDALKKLLKPEILSECWCFWGLYDIVRMSKEQYENLPPEEKKKYYLDVYIDPEGGGEYYFIYSREWQMNIVPGYEEILYHSASDKSIYHPPAGSGAPLPGKIKLTNDARDTVITVVQPDGSINATTYLETEVSQLVTAGDEDCFVLYVTPKRRSIDKNYVGKNWEKGDEGKGYYGIAYVDVDKGVNVPWTYENRLGVIRANYGPKRNKYRANDYSISNAAPEINGKLPGLDY